MSGWEDLEGAVVVPIDQKRDDIDIMIARTFGSDEGKKVLGWLFNRYVKTDNWLPGAEPSIGFYRSGQSEVVRDILKRIERIKG